ncbi:protein kinase [Sulfolobus tengchongensis]|uniref:Protein kinase n=1 Tax=Sulfolobus tengchongensis TaxID=207809 RepID=A0AAX4KYB5_9CREN
MRITVLQYVAGFLGFVSIPYGILSLIKSGSIIGIKSIEDIILIFFGFFALSYTFTTKIMIEKPFALTFSVILFYLSLFTPMPLLNKVLLIAGAIVETQIASRRNIGGTIYTIIGILILLYFIYEYFLGVSLMSLAGVGISSLIIVLANRDKGIKYISYFAFPIGLPLILYSVTSLFPISINPVPLIIGVALILLNIVPIGKSQQPSISHDSKLAESLCSNIQKSDCKGAIEIYKKYMVYIPQNCLEKIILCAITQNNIQDFNLIINNNNARSLAEKYVDKMTPEMIYSLALLSSKKNELLDLACKKGFKKACEQTKPILDLNNWDPRIWMGKELYDYKVVDIIGVGGTSYILKGEKDGNLYALKVPLAKYLNNIMDLVGESSKLIELSNKSPYIVKLYAIYADQLDVKEIISGNAEIYYNKPPMLVTELMKGGSINDILAVREIVQSEFWRKIVFITTSKISEALEVIHSEGYVHCDIKPQNILLSEKLPPYAKLAYDNIRANKIVVKLADLGSSVRAGQKPFSYTPAYASFDLVKSTVFGGVSPMSDIYELGATVYKLLTGSTLNTKEMIDAMDRFDVSRDVKYLDYSLYSARNLSLLRKYVDRDTSSFITRMVDPDPNRRPTSKEVKEFFSSKI